MKVYYWVKRCQLQLVCVASAMYQRFHRDRLTRHAAALSFNSLLALAPILAIALAMVSFFSGHSGIGQSFQEYIYQFLLPSAGDELRVYLEKFAHQAGQLTSIGVLFFLMTALLLLSNIESSFNDIWRAEKARDMSSKISVYWALLTLGPLLMGASLAVSAYLLSTELSNISPWLHPLQTLLGTFLPYFFDTTAFCLLYYIMPNVPVRFSYALIGGLFAAVLFQISKKLFALYLVNFNNYEVIYGALATLPIFLIWIYLSWLVALLGAELVAVLQTANQRTHPVKMKNK